MKLIKLALPILCSLFCYNSYSQFGSGGGSTTTAPYYSDADSNYATFAQQNFIFLNQDTSYAGRKKLKYFHRDYSFWKTRLGNISSTGNTKEYGMAINSLKSYPCTTIDSANWNCEGPFRAKSIAYPSGAISYPHAMGLIGAVYMNPNNQNEILAGSSSSGIWRTTDRGINWINVTDNIRTPHLGIGNFSVNPNNSNEIIASTGKYRRNMHHLHYGPSILKSTDGGATWNEMNLSSSVFAISDGPIIKVRYNPYTSNEIYALVDDKHGGLFKSINNGATFTKVFEMSRDINPLVKKQQNGRNFQIMKNGNIIISSSNLFGDTCQSFISKDAGITWGDLFNNPSITDFNTHLFNKAVIRSSISDPIDSLIYMGVRMQNNPDIYIFKSINYGNSFYLYARYVSTAYMTDASIIAPSLTNSSELHIGAKFYYSHDSISGSNTRRSPFASAVADAEGHIDIRAMQVLKDTNGEEIVIIGDDGGINLHNYTNPASPVKISLNGNSLPITQFYRLGISQYGSKNKIVAGGMDNGNFLFDKSTNEWINIGLGDGSASWIKYDNNEYIIHDGFGFFNYGENHSRRDIVKYGGSASFDNFSINTPLKVIKNGKKTYYATNRSNQLGINFNLRNATVSNLNTYYNINWIQQIGEIGADEYNENIVWVSEERPSPPNSNKLFKSIDGGVTFSNMASKLVYSDSNGVQVSTQVYKLLENKIITSIEINPKDNKEMWMSISGVYDATNDWNKVDSTRQQIRIVHSTDSGNTWYDWSHGLPKPRIPVNNLIFHQQSEGLVFCATDMGVYYRNNTTNEWKCFQTGLPPIIVNDLKINYCENKIYCATFGRGIYSSDIPASIVTNGEREIAINTLIDYTMFTPYDIRIKSGAILTVTDTLIFATGRRIIVEAGAKLIMNGGTLTSRCGDTWDGIYGMGLAGTDQIPTNQGTVYLNNSLIENAKVGFRAKNPYSSGGHGAIIKASNTTFLNNEKDLEFLPYHNTFVTAGAESPNRCELNNCTFLIDDNLITSNPSDRVSMTDVYGIQFYGCDFADNRGTMNANNKANGILSIDASYTVDESCTSPVTPCTSTKRGSFKNFEHGIEAFGDDKTNQIAVEHIDFTNNKGGISLEGTQSSRVVNNTFTTNLSHSFGLYLMSSEGYHVEGNDFITSSAVGVKNQTIGTIVYNKHGNDELVYRNYYDNNEEAIETIGWNKEYDNNEMIHIGLVLKCNDFNRSTSEDIYVTDDPLVNFSVPFLGIKKYQGIAGGSNKELAGNLFSNVNSTKFWVNNELESFDYFHHNEIVTSRVKPTNWTATTASMITSPIIRNNFSCPDSTGNSNVTLGGLISLITTNKTLENQNISTLQALVDGGNTPLLVSEVTSTTNTSAYQHYLDIMAESGYVSEEVLEEVANQENGFTLAMIRDILVANTHSASSEEIQKILDERITELPAFMRIQILAGLNQVSPLEYMTRVISKFSTRKNEAIRRALQVLRADSNATLQEFESVLVNTNNLYYDLQLVSLYDNYEKSEMADQLLAEIEEDAYSSEGFKDYFNDFKNLRATINGWENKEFYELDENQLSDLETYLDKQNPSSALARKLLVANNQPVAVRPFYFSDNTENEPKKKRTFNVEGIEQSSFSIYPNPTKNFVTLTYTILETGKNKKFVLVNALGEIVKSQDLITHQDQIVIQLDKLAPSEYIGFILVDGKSIGSKKLSVIK